MRLLATAGICYIISEGGKAHTFQLYLWSKTYTHTLTHSHTAPAISSQESLAETRPRSLVATEIRAMFCNTTSAAGFVVHYRGAPCIFRGLLHTFACKYLHVSETWFCSDMPVEITMKKENGHKSSCNMKVRHAMIRISFFFLLLWWCNFSTANEFFSLS